MCCFCCCEGSSSSDSGRAKRGCTDICFLFLFIVAIGGLGFIASFSWQQGDIYKIVYGSDSFGNTCGRENEVLFYKDGTSSVMRKLRHSGQNFTDAKFMLPMDISKALTTVWTCTSRCPSTAITQPTEIEKMAHEGVDVCISHNSSLSASRMRMGMVGECPKLPLMESVPIVNRCIPRDIFSFSGHIFEQFVAFLRGVDWVREVISDLTVSSDHILKMCALAAGLSLLSVVLLRVFSKFMIYIAFAVIVVLVIGFTASLWYAWYLSLTARVSGATPTAPSPSTLAPPPLTPAASMRSIEQLATDSIVQQIQVDSWFRIEKIDDGALLGCAIGASVIAMFILFIVWCMFPQGSMLDELFVKASRALTSMPLLLLQPIVTTAVVLALAGYSATVMGLLWTTGEPSPKDVTHDDQTVTTVEYNVTERTKTLMWVQVAGFVWLSEFALASQRMLIAGAVARWYIYRQSGVSAVVSSFCQMMRCHLGTMALGSLIITIVRFPRYVVMWINMKLKASENRALRCLLSCIVCILSAIERILRYINYNAYTMTAITGQSFCPAARDSLTLLGENAVSLATVKTLGVFALFLTKLCVACGTAMYTFMHMKERADVIYWWLPVVVVFFLAYQIANCFLSIYEMVVDAVFLCYLYVSRHPREAERAEGGGNEGDNPHAEWNDYSTLLRSSLRRRKGQRTEDIYGDQEMAPMHR